MNRQTDTPTILIVDDHPGNLSVVVNLLEDRGYRVALAQDGEEGLLRAQLAQPSLILLDVMLPGADGFEICWRLKADEKTRDIPVIFMIALASTEHKVKGFDAGGVDYLTKPLQIDETLARVDTHIKLYAAQRQLEKYSEELGLRVAERTAELAESERQFRSLAENAPDNIARYDRQGHMLYVNPRLEQTLGLAARDAIGKTPSEIFPDADLTPITTVAATGQPVEIEVTLPDSGAGLRYHNIRFVPERGGNGETVSVLAIGRDITERKQAEERLALAHFALDHAQEGAFLMDSQARFHYVNEEACRSLGYEREELLSMDVFDIDPDLPRDLWRLLWSNTAKKGSRTIQTRHRAKDGRIFPIEVVASRLEYGGNSYNLAMTRDITERKEAERKIAEAYIQIQELAAHREEALEDERKRIARDMHDELSQCLTAMRMDIAVLRMRFGAGNPEMLAQVQNVLSLLDRTIQAVRSMVTRLRPAPLEMGIVSALEWLVEDFSSRTGVSCELDAGSEEIGMSDNQATALFRIVQESLTNVARYAQANQMGVRLEISGNDYLLQIRDDGKGFDIAAARKKSFGLLGIRERVAILGGKANISSAPGQGVTIEVRIPIQEPS